MVLVQADERYDIFSDERLRNKYEETIRRYEERYSFELITVKYSGTVSLMIIRISDLPTSKIMQSILTSFTRYLNGYFGHGGKKLKDRYRAVTLKDEYLDEVLAMELIDLLNPEKIKRFIRKKGKIIDFKIHKKRTSFVEERFMRTLDEIGMDPADRDARHAHIVLLRRYTLLTNRQIAVMEKVTESAVSKILSREKIPDKETDIIRGFESQ